MKARLTTGEVVELEKDCTCLDEIHTGPHWLHMDDFDFRRNADLVKQADAIDARDRIAFMRKEALLNRAFQFEVARLAEKERGMKNRCIEGIIR
jgi:hypothetical protein